MSIKLLIETPWRLIIVVVCLNVLANETDFVGMSAIIISYTGVYWALIPFIDEVIKIIKEKKLFCKNKKHKEGENE